MKTVKIHSWKWSKIHFRFFCFLLFFTILQESRNLLQTNIQSFTIVHDDHCHTTYICITTSHTYKTHECFNCYLSHFVSFLLLHRSYLILIHWHEWVYVCACVYVDIQCSMLVCNNAFPSLHASRLIFMITYFIHIIIVYTLTIDLLCLENKVWA